MHLALFFAVFCLSTLNGLADKDERKEQHCDVLKQLLGSLVVAVEIKKNGFHRELVISVELIHDDLRGVQALLVYSWPRGVYIDPYQLLSLSDHRDWQALIDSAIDLELPAHKTSGFVSYIYPASDGPTPRMIEVAIPVHARYHQPSVDGQLFTSIEIKPPKLLLQMKTCPQLDRSEPHVVVEAPCTHKNLSTCSWLQLQLQHQQDGGSMSFQIPVGDESMVIPVCAGTLLVTVICCFVMSKYTWKHRID